MQTEYCHQEMYFLPVLTCYIHFEKILVDHGVDFEKDAKFLLKRRKLMLLQRNFPAKDDLYMYLECIL